MSGKGIRGRGDGLEEWNGFMLEGLFLPLMALRQRFFLHFAAAKVFPDILAGTWRFWDKCSRDLLEAACVCRI